MKVFPLLSLIALLLGGAGVPFAAAWASMETAASMARSLEMEGRTPPRPGSGRRDIL